MEHSKVRCRHPDDLEVVLAARVLVVTLFYSLDRDPERRSLKAEKKKCDRIDMMSIVKSESRSESRECSLPREVDFEYRMLSRYFIQNSFSITVYCTKEPRQISYTTQHAQYTPAHRGCTHGI